jgi:hypothetical protein
MGTRDEEFTTEDTKEEEVHGGMVVGEGWDGHGMAS